MKMKCFRCGIVEVNDDAYAIQERARGYFSMLGDSLFRVHPLTCECGAVLEDM